MKKSMGMKQIIIQLLGMVWVGLAVYLSYLLTGYTWWKILSLYLLYSAGHNCINYIDKEM